MFLKMFSLVGLLGFKKKIFFSILILSSIFASLLEIIGLGLLIPIVSSLFDNTFYLKFNEYSIKYDLPEFTSQSFLFFCIILLPLVFIFKNLFLFFFHKIEANLIYNTLTEFSKKIYKIFLTQKYSFYVNENSSNFVNKLGSEFNNLHNYIIASVSFFTEIIILFALLFFLLFIAFEEIIIIFLVVLISIFIFYLIFYKKKNKFGEL